MLRGFIKEWRRPFGGASIEEQVEEELLFHCEMLMEEYRELGMSEDAAREAASKRFGDRERVQAECVEISRRSRPAVKLLKLFLLLFFVSGFSLRMASTIVQFKQVADMLMATGVLGQLLLHLRGLRATGFRPIKASAPFSVLGLRTQASIEAFDEEGRTPVERLVADKPFRDS